MVTNNDTPRVDALMAEWDDDGATRGSAFIELRDLARELESELARRSTAHNVGTSSGSELAGKRTEFPLERAINTACKMLENDNTPERTLMAEFLRKSYESVIAQQSGAPAVSVKDALRRCGADTDYHGKMAFTVRQFEHFVSMIAAPAPAAEEVRDAKDAVAYRFWRDSMLAEDESFVQAVMEALPNGQSDAPPSADEWDAAIAIVMRDRAAAMSASQGKTEEAK